MYRHLISMAVVLVTVALASQAISAHGLTKQDKVEITSETRLTRTPTVAIHSTVTTHDTSLARVIWTDANWDTHISHRSNQATWKNWGALQWHAGKHTETAAVTVTHLGGSRLGQLPLEETQSLTELHYVTWKVASALQTDVGWRSDWLTQTQGVWGSQNTL